MKPGLALATMAMLLVPSVNGAPETHAAEAVQGAAKARLPQGEQVFQQYCQACHQANGQGLTGAFPPLAESDYLLADPKRGIVAVLQGLEWPDHRQRHQVRLGDASPQLPDGRADRRCAHLCVEQLGQRWRRHRPRAGGRASSRGDGRARRRPASGPARGRDALMAPLRARSPAPRPCRWCRPRDRL